MEKQEQKAIELLKEIVEWWGKWNNSDDPTELEDPPIQEAQNLLTRVDVS